MRHTCCCLVITCLLAVGCSSDRGSDDVRIIDRPPSDVGTSDAGPSRDDAGCAIEPAGDDITGGDWDALGGSDAERFQSQLDAAVTNLGLPGTAMAVARVSEREIWAGASGTVDPAGEEPWEADRMFRIGSVTKTFTTALILQLVDDGVVSLDDPLEQWVPGYYDDQGVKIRHLATNTSGIVSYNYVGSFDQSRAWTPAELVEWAVEHGPKVQFEPGSQFEYSNTNFVLLGMVIEEATCGSYADAVETHLLQPLDLTDTYVAASGDQNERVVRGFDEDGTELTDAADPSMGYSAGAIVTTPRDLARWGAALYGGDVLSPEMLELMTTAAVVGPEGERYGMGAFIEGEGDETTIGHTGGTPGYLTYMYYLRSEQAVVVAMTNVFGTDLRELSAYGWSVVLDVPYP